MRLFLASDIHGSVVKLKSALESERFDLIVLAGDLSNGPVSRAREVLRTARSFGPVLFVPGNMDSPELLKLEEMEGCENLHGRVISREFRFGGLGGGNLSPFNTPIELSEEEIVAILSRLGDVDVLVSHPPPKGTKLDVIRTGAHVGSDGVRRYLEERQPILCVCGHIHESPGIDHLGKTVLVNPGPMMIGRYAIIEIREREILPQLKMLH